MILKCRKSLLTPNFIPAAVLIKVRFVEEMVVFWVMVKSMKGLLRCAAAEMYLMVIGMLQGKRIILVVAVVLVEGKLLVQVISVQRVFLMHCWRAPVSRLAIIVSKALQVSIDCC